MIRRNKDRRGDDEEPESFKRKKRESETGGVFKKKISNKGKEVGKGERIREARNAIVIEIIAHHLRLSS
jgi:hypothetical protein